jgi:hypothetical protein
MTQISTHTNDEKKMDEILLKVLQGLSREKFLDIIVKYLDVKTYIPNSSDNTEWNLIHQIYTMDEFNVFWSHNINGNFYELLKKMYNILHKILWDDNIEYVHKIKDYVKDAKNYYLYHYTTAIRSNTRVIQELHDNFNKGLEIDVQLIILRAIYFMDVIKTKYNISEWFDSLCYKLILSCTNLSAKVMYDVVFNMGQFTKYMHEMKTCNPCKCEGKYECNKCEDICSFNKGSGVYNCKRCKERRCNCIRCKGQCTFIKCERTLFRMLDYNCHIKDGDFLKFAYDFLYNVDHIRNEFNLPSPDNVHSPIRNTILTSSNCHYIKMEIELEMELEKEKEREKEKEMEMEIPYEIINRNGIDTPIPKPLNMMGTLS